MCKTLPAGEYRIKGLSMSLYLKEDCEPFAANETQTFYKMLNIIGEEVFVPENDIIWEKSILEEMETYSVGYNSNPTMGSTDTTGTTMKPVTKKIAKRKKKNKKYHKKIKDMIKKKGIPVEPTNTESDGE